MSLLGQSKRRIVLQITRLLQPLGIDWVITGSAAQALQGAPVMPKDIDIKTRAEDIQAVENGLRAYITEPVHYRVSERFRSFFGRAVIDGEEIDLMGGLELLTTNGEWIPAGDPVHYRVYVQMDGIEIPVVDVRHAALTYRQMGRTERADLLDRWLKEQEGYAPA